MSEESRSASGRRATRQRAAIFTALRDAGRFRTAQELHRQLSSTGERVGLTTVYRTLQALADADEVDVLRKGDGEAMYRRCRTGSHHHHLVCESCGISVEVASDDIERWARRMASTHGFTSVSHTAELYGICRDCSSS